MSPGASTSPTLENSTAGSAEAPVFLTVVVRCLNSESTLGAQLEALARQHTRYAWEVVVVDNGSTDNSLGVIEAYRDRLPQLRVVVKAAPRGSAIAGNVGVQAAAGEYVAFADADDVVSDEWVEQLAGALVHYPVAVSRHDYSLLNRGGNRDRDNQSTGPQRAWYPPYYFHSGACGLGIAKHVFEDVGGFDRTMAVGADTDLCFKLQRAGYELRFVPEAIVHVRARERPAEAFHQARRWAAMNSLMYRRYRLPDQRLVRPWKTFARQLRWVVHAARRAQRAGRPTEVAWHLGWYVGLMEGSLRYLQPPLASDRESVRHLGTSGTEEPAESVQPGDAPWG